MISLVLEKKKLLSVREIEIQEELGPDDVRVSIKKVGICGSDLSYYMHGSIGHFVVRSPLVLGHEAAGIISEVGSKVADLKPGDAVCMEPGIPQMNSQPSRMGMYNLDPGIRFWATPPVHGILRPSVVHPAAFTYKLPKGVDLSEGALVEPLAIGFHAARMAQIRPSDIAVVTGLGTIGIMTTIAALAGGCSRVIAIDKKQSRLQIAATLGSVTTCNIEREDAEKVVQTITAKWGADIVFEASGNQDAAASLPKYVCPGGKIIYIGSPHSGIVPFDISACQSKEVTISTIFRYAHIFPRVLQFISTGKIDIKPLITETYPFKDSIKAFEYACAPSGQSVKTQIELP